MSAGTRRAPRDRGQVSLEFVAMLPILLIVALGAVQLGVAVYASQQAGSAARAAARVASLDPEDADTTPQAAAEAAVSDFLGAVGVAGGPAGDQATVTVTLQVPDLLPGIAIGTTSRTVTMPVDDPDAP
ncbi:TadE/TadG family type IV pilus assembly protein [Streptomyces sp. NPDC060194]|uniref:TadE/TadG family type IV pilus assembly protein n=1 Tax=Streptomyces sp. NPDC060194 TaxID=3347069 RepID=UPI0036662846